MQPSLAGAIGGLLLMRFTDAIGAIAIAVMPLLAIPLLIAVGAIDFNYAGLYIATGLIGLTVIGGHFGMHTLAGMYYPSHYRANGTGWATSVAKVGSIVGPWLAGIIPFDQPARPQHLCNPGNLPGGRPDLCCPDRTHPHEAAARGECAASATNLVAQ